MTNDALDTQLAGLRERFRARALDDARRLDDLAAGLEGSDRQAIDREPIRAIAHRLAGAAGTFGFADLTGPAAELELLTLGDPRAADLAGAGRGLAMRIRQSMARLS